MESRRVFFVAHLIRQVVVTNSLFIGVDVQMNPSAYLARPVWIQITQYLGSEEMWRIPPILKKNVSCWNPLYKQAPCFVVFPGREPLKKNSSWIMVDIELGDCVCTSLQVQPVFKATWCGGKGAINQTYQSLSNPFKHLPQKGVFFHFFLGMFKPHPFSISYFSTKLERWLKTTDRWTVESDEVCVHHVVFHWICDAGGCIWKAIFLLLRVGVTQLQNDVALEF